MRPSASTSSSRLTFARSTLVTDTSVVYAALDSSDRNHRRCADLLASGSPVVLPAPVVTEVTVLSRSRSNDRAVAVLLRGILEEALAVVDLQWQDYARSRQLVEIYSDVRLGFVDAAIVAVAERLGETTIATLDHRHFSVVRPLHCERFTLVP